MESLTKRILAIVLIAVVGTGIGLGAWFFALAPGAGAFAWSAADAPGAPAGTTADQMIKIGLIGDTGEIQGDGTWEGGYLAAKEINEAGGVLINGSTYYVAVTIEDSDESNPNLVTSRGVAAAERLVYSKGVDYAIGGFRSEAVLAYQEVFMDNKIVFINTGAATDIFTENVLSWYARYKYFFRTNPINSTALGGEILAFMVTMVTILNATYTNTDIRTVGLLYEDLTWTTSLVGALKLYLPLLTGGWITIPAAADIAYDVTLSATDMNTHLQTLTTAGIDFLIPAISAQGGIMMMQQYAILEPDYVIIGIDVQSQLDTFWAQSNGDALYETIMQGVHRVNKTSKTIAFWDAFRAEYGHDPLYTAVGTYDTVYTLIDAIVNGQDFDSDTVVTELEAFDIGNPHEGAGGTLAFLASHDTMEGFGYGYTLWCQWQANGTKVVVPAYGARYPTGAIAPMGTYTLPPWITWT